LLKKENIHNTFSFFFLYFFLFFLFSLQLVPSSHRVYLFFLLTSHVSAPPSPIRLTLIATHAQRARPCMAWQLGG
jgi:hypothetical protein